MNFKYKGIHFILQENKSQIFSALPINKKLILKNRSATTSKNLMKFRKRKKEKKKEGAIRVAIISLSLRIRSLIFFFCFVCFLDNDSTENE